jgi:site-specific DNA recombinase
VAIHRLGLFNGLHEDRQSPHVIVRFRTLTPVQGLVECMCCGYSYYGKPAHGGRANGKQRRYEYYRCIGTDAYRFGGNRICDNKQLRVPVLDEAVWEDVCDLLRDPERIQSEYRRRLSGDNDNSSLALKQNQTSINKLKRSIARLIDAYGDDLLTKEEFQPRIEQSRNRLAQLESEQLKLQTHVREQDELRCVIQHLDQFSRQLSDNLAGYQGVASALSVTTYRGCER